MEESATPTGRGNRPLRLLAFALAFGALIALIVVIGFHNMIARAVLGSVARGLGYDVTTRALDISLGEAVLSDVKVTNVRGEPVFDAQRIDVAFSLRDLLPGGKRLFGLKSVSVAAPHITVIHHPDGSYNITLPASSQSSAKPASGALDVRVQVTGGSIDLIDRYVIAPRERSVHIVDMTVAGAISALTPSTYRGGAVLLDDSRRYPIHGSGRFADARGFELQHWTAARLPIAALADFGLSTHVINVVAGEIDDLDIKLGALATSAGTLQSHLGVSGRIAGVRLATTALTKPVRDARGSFVVDDDSLTVRDLDAAVGNVPLHVRGALYHFAAPQIAFALTTHGDLSDIRQLSPDIARLPVAGAVSVQGLAEGPASNPLVFARFSAPNVSYGTYRFDGPQGFVAISGQELDILAAGVRYGTLDVAARGALELQRHTQTVGYALVHAPANALPYVDNLIPGMALAGTAVVRGADGKLAARGYLGGSTAGDRLDVPFSIGESGSGTIGPIALVRHDGASVYARAVIDRPSNRTVALVDAHALSLLPAPTVTLPGLQLPPLPPQLDVKADATLAAIAVGTTLATANGTLHAYGPWGDVRAVADGSGQHFAARGRLTSSFEQLAALGANAGAHGGIDVPFAVTDGAHSTIVQVAGATFSNASVHGVPFTSANATLGVGPHAIDIYSADLRIAGRDITAQGSFGNGGRVHVTAGDLDLATLRAAGIPLVDGRATVIADVGGTPTRPVAELLAALGGARFGGTDVGGDVGLAYDGAVLRVNRATVTYGGAYANAVGSVSGLALGHIAPRYALHAQLEDADIATLAHTVKNPLRYPEGTLEADLRVSGAGSSPAVAGDISVPEGSLNGLNFRAGRVNLGGGPTALQARGGRLTVGGTLVAFSGNVSRSQQSVRLRTEHLDLADFNDYFDEADVLAGTGDAALALDAAPSRIHTSADLALKGTRYRRFDLGTIGATVRTIGSAIRIHGELAGQNGRLDLAGSINVPVTDPLRDIAHRSFVDMNGQIAGLNLGNVLPAAGLFVPVAGILDGSAIVRGRYPALALSTRASLGNGVAGRLPIERFTVAATAVNGRGRLTDLTLVAPGLTASMNGTFGLRPQDAFDLRAQAMSPAIKTLAIAATGKDPGVTGTLDVRARVSGTMAGPHVTSSIDLNDLQYNAVTIPRAHADIAATRQSVDVRNGTIGLPRGGSIGFDGHAPLSTAPGTPIAFDFVPHNINVNPYSALLPDGSVIEGIFDGNVGVRGTLAAPQLTGGLSFANGSYRSNTIKSPLTALTLQLNFAGTGVQIAKLHGHAGPGNFDGTGALTVGDLRDPVRGLRANFGLTASNAVVSAPKLYAGSIDGTLTVTKRVSSPVLVGGDLTFSSARIPYTALMPSGGSASTAAPVLPDVDFDLGVTVGRDVRIQSGPVDVGTTGAAQLGGTLAKPTLKGQFIATDGTVSVYRTFVVQNGSSVTFDPSDGVTPSVDATAVTQVPDPATQVLLHITGLSTQLNLAFSSEPAYSQQQILGLLVNAQALGAVSGVAQSSGAGSPAPSVTGIGEGVLADQFQAKFLQSFTSKLGGSLGLSDLNVNYNTNGSVSAVARRSIAKNISFTYGEQIGGPTPRTSVGINIGNSIAGAQLTFYQAAGSSEAFGGQSLTPYLQSGFLATSPPNYTLQAIEPPSGSGFVFSYQRHFW